MNDAADRIRQRMAELKISQADIKRATGAGKATISSWVKGDTNPSGAYASKLAAVLKCDTDWLLTGRGETNKPTLNELKAKIAMIQKGDNDALSPEHTKRINLLELGEVPIISWVAAGNWSDTEPVTLADAIGSAPRPANLSKNGFALVVRGRSMMPKFEPNDIIYIEPETGLFMLKDGDLVVVQCNDDSEATFKQLVLGETSDDMYLKPLNPDWPEQKMIPMGDCCLVGKVVGKFAIY